MSAHCHVCGFDLPYEGDCQYCTVKAELQASRRQAEEVGIELGSWADHLESEGHCFEGRSLRSLASKLTHDQQGEPR